MLSIVILISGNGTNLQAIINAISNGLPVKILAVISDNPDAFGLERARRAHIPTHVVNYRQAASRVIAEGQLITLIDRYSPQYIILAGFMRLLSADFVRHYQNHLINIHPALLPKHKGLHTHHAVLAAHETEHGVTVHYVTEEMDSGPIICQAKLTVLPEDTVDTLQARVHQLEYKIYPQVLAWIAAERVVLRDNTVYFDGRPQTTVKIIE